LEVSARQGAAIRIPSRETSASLQRSRAMLQEYVVVAAMYVDDLILRQPPDAGPRIEARRTPRANVSKRGRS
jgi:hypothetical protein